MKIKIVAFKASKRTIALILVSVLLIISVIGWVDYKVAFERARVSAIEWHSLSDQYLAELEEANQELDTANRTIYEQDVQITALRETNVKLNAQLTTANSQIASLTFHFGDDMLVPPRQSSMFDCDDSALYMYLYFISRGDEVHIIEGNLDRVNESWYQCNHVWLWVKSGSSPWSREFAYDWGRCYYDDQHYWGYPMTYKELLRAALYDQ